MVQRLISRHRRRLRTATEEVVVVVVVVPSGRGPAYSGPMPIALTQEGRSQVDDVCECVRD